MQAALAARRFRDALALFPTGVAIATAAGEDGAPLGLTISSFTSVSLDPPLVLFCIDRRALSLPAWLRAPGYAVNVLAGPQQALSSQFARARGAKWAGVEFDAGLHGAPLLRGALAHFECEAYDHVGGGDHVIFVGRVERFATRPAAHPLVFHRGRYASVHAADAAAEDEAALAAAWPLSIHY